MQIVVAGGDQGGQLTNYCVRRNREPDALRPIYDSGRNPHDLSLAVQKGSARVARVYRSAELNRARNREVSGNRVLNCPSNLTDDSKSHRTGKAERVSNCNDRLSNLK